ncbi:hypothetical protein ACJRO7_015379 [Eucalyptus globulus]|uniref:TIR domain-containing protein n=1 Tax=Eucalyptus globulus TaxID=34317 RepID=A0ABD3L8Z4_EUCGL
MKRRRSSSPKTGSTSHGSSGTEYDVFMSFRGPDTHANFTNSLCHTLMDKCINVFIDKQGINVGEEIGPEIFQAIDNSKICIPIFSRDYASSSWCLRELEHVMQRWKTNELEVMPIFYDVEPSDMKLETRVYADALTLHKEKHGAEIVQRWAEALREVTGIKGWDTKNRDHEELARMIAQKVLVKLKVSCVDISDHLVGMDGSVNEVVNLLNVEYEDVRLIGLWGMAGIGKTTLAKVVYNKLSSNFDGCSFISDIREASRGSGMLDLQRRLISDVTGDTKVRLSSIDHGKNMIKRQFCGKRFLIFLDDVDDVSQLRALVEKKECFGLGSRIVVTTRDRSVFAEFQDQFDCCLVYEVNELDTHVALQLFSKHAFRRNSPPNEFLSLSKEVIAYTGGLPLAIEAIGLFLRGKKELVWQVTLKKMKYCQQRDVHEKLMSSYEALDHPQQQIFLDIACFLSGEKESYATYMWDDCGFFPDEGIEILHLMSLVKIRGENRLWMHDQLKALGRSIVHQENCKDPIKGSRVWYGQGGPDIVQQKKGTGTVAAYYNQSEVPLQDSVLTSKDFIEVPNIRFLKLSYQTLSGDFGDLFSELRWLTWCGCPKEMQATNFCPKNLVILDLGWSSSIDEHWGGWTQLKVATRLKVLDLSYNKMLKETPELSAFLSLERLILKGCKMLMKLSDSIGMLKYLVLLDVSYTNIVELPNSIANLKRLKVLNISGSCMRKLPDAIGMMEKLEEIYGANCQQLEVIPSDIVGLPSLQILKLTGTRVENVPVLLQSLRMKKMKDEARQLAADRETSDTICTTAAVQNVFGIGDRVKQITDFLEAEVNDESKVKMEEEARQRAADLETSDRNYAIAAVQNVVGIDDRVKQITDLLEMEVNDEVRIIGIYGTHGIGKTTLAKAVYNRISSCFNSCSFLAEVEQTTQNPRGIQFLQTKLIRDILQRDREDPSFDERIESFLDIFREMKVLIVVDDVERQSHLQAIVGDQPHWFGLGSRIIVTSNNSEILKEYDLGKTRSYMVHQLDNGQAFELFCKHAFGRQSSIHAYDGLPNCIVNATVKLPLAVEVIGSFLRGKSVEEWKKMEELMKQLMTSSQRTTVGCKEILDICYKALDPKQKHVFLDIACFISGMDARIASYMWSNPHLPSSDCILMPLAKTGENNELQIHRLLRCLGKRILDQEESEDPIPRKFHIHVTVPEAISNDKGMENIEALCFDLDDHDSCVFTARHFESMPGIRFLQLDNARVSGDFACAFPSLRWLCWQRCPLDFGAMNFVLRELVIFDLSWSKVVEDWGGWSEIKVV